MNPLEVHDLTFAYPLTEGVLRGVNLTVRAGELVIVLGPSGSGKSTLLKVLSGISPYLTGGTLSGTVKVFGKNMKIKGERDEVLGRVFYMPQEPESYLVFRKAITEAVVPYLQVSTTLGEAEKRGYRLLKRWLPALPPRSSTSTLSAGEKQRLVLSHLEVSESGLLLLDEPLTHLDERGRELFRRCVWEKLDCGGAVIVATPTLYGYKELLRRAERTLWMDGGILKELPDNSPEDLREMLSTHHPKKLEADGSVRVGGRGDCLRSYVSHVKKKGKRRDVLKRGAEKRKTLILSRSLDVTLGGRRILSGVTFTLKEGQSLIIKGPNGSGKTTLIRALLGFVKPESGSLKAPWLSSEGWNGGGGYCVGYLPQNPLNMFTSETLLEDMHLSWSRGRKLEPFRKAYRRLFSIFSLSGLEDSDPYDLSTGQRQRAALANLLVRYPNVVFLDEPTRGMDVKSHTALKMVIEKLLGECSVVVATHSSLFDPLADKVLRLDGGVLSGK